jgi:hypothetical protein
VTLGAHDVLRRTAACASLTDLNLADNVFTRVGALAPLTQLPQVRVRRELFERHPRIPWCQPAPSKRHPRTPQLRVLDVQDNDALCETRHLKRLLLALLPAVRRLNGDGTGAGTGQHHRGPLVLDGTGAGTVFAHNVDRSSCSCVEGAPACSQRVWKAVASESRRKAAARLDLEVSAGWVGQFPRALGGGDALLDMRRPITIRSVRTSGGQGNTYEARRCCRSTPSPCSVRASCLSGR